MLTILFGVVSVVSVYLTVHYGRKAAALEKRRRTATWQDLQLFMDSLALQLRRDGFEPDVILAPGTRGGAIAELLTGRIGRGVPVMVGVSYWHHGQQNSPVTGPYRRFQILDGWDILIPKAVLQFKERKLLVVDDFCLTGEFFSELRGYLCDKGFAPENVRVFCAVITRVTVSGDRAPEYHSLVVDDDQFFFPWGKACLG